MTRAVTMPVMQAAVHILKDEGVDVAFGCPGAAILPLYKAMEVCGGIEHLTVRHEEGATHMADGWARTNGRVGVAIATSGPGGTNLVTGLYTAFADSIPMLCITGQAVSGKLHQEAFQAVDIVSIARPVTKWAVQIKEAAQIPWVFREAFRIAREGRPGPSSSTSRWTSPGRRSATTPRRTPRCPCGPPRRTRRASRPPSICCWPHGVRWSWPGAG
ncbi:hypothetical protein GCM10020000_16810 [Streptomyces olivoverticillatus]